VTDLDVMEARAKAVKAGEWPLETVGDFHDPGWMISGIVRDPKGDNALDFGTDKALGEFVSHARADVLALVARVRELENTAPSDEGTRADILRWAAHQLHQTPVQCTALTGPYWYGSGWKDAAVTWKTSRTGKHTPPVTTTNGPPCTNESPPPRSPSPSASARPPSATPRPGTPPSACPAPRPTTSPRW